MVRRCVAAVVVSALVLSGLKGGVALAHGPGEGVPLGDVLAEIQVLPAQGTVTQADVTTRAIVGAAEAFLATLTAEQRAAAIYDAGNAAQRANWTNFPEGGSPNARGGVKWGDMDQSQRDALLALLGALLSPAGLENVVGQMAADDLVAAGDHGDGAAEGRPPVNFGSDFYFVSFVGAPSEDVPFLIQFGGHHLALHATVAGADVTLSPSLTGGEPLKFLHDGRAVHLTIDEAEAASALLNSLTVDQRVIAVQDDVLANLQLGPGQDGHVLEPVGLAGAAMTPVQRDLLLKVIGARINMLNADDASVMMAAISRDLDQTYFGWWGPDQPVGAAYFRITAPTAIIEFAPQTNDGDATDHAHNMYRDPTNEYGARYSPAN